MGPANHLLRIAYYCDTLPPIVIPSEVLPSAWRRAERSREPALSERSESNGNLLSPAPRSRFLDSQRRPLTDPFAALEMTEIAYV